MWFLLSLIVQAAFAQSKGEFSYGLEIELRNVTSYALENQAEWTDEHLQQIKEYEAKQNDETSVTRYFCYQWLIFVRQQRGGDNKGLQLCSDVIECDQDDCPITGECLFEACNVKIVETNENATSYIVGTSLFNTFDGVSSYSEFDQFRNGLNSDLLVALEKLKKRDHYGLVEDIQLTAKSFYCDQCAENIDSEGDDDETDEPSGDELTNIAATYTFHNRIAVTAELEAATIEEMQDELQHIHHLAGQMMLLLQPKQAASSVIFEFDATNMEYQINWVFRGEFETTTEKELAEIGDAVAKQGDSVTNEFVASEAQITGLSEATSYTIEKSSFDPNSCAGSKIQYDINVEAHMSSSSNAQGLIDEICAKCLKTAPHVSIHDLVDIGCSSTDLGDNKYLVNYGFNHQMSSAEYPDATIERYSNVLLEQSTMCVDGMIASGSLLDTTSVDVVYKAICGTIVEYQFPIESTIAAVLGSLAGLALVALTVKLMIDDQKVLFEKGTEVKETKVMNTEADAQL